MNTNPIEETETHPVTVQQQHSPNNTMPGNNKKSFTKKPSDIRPLSATLQLDRRNKMLYNPLQIRAYDNQGLLNVGAIKSAMSENELRRILQAHPAAQLEEYPAPDFQVHLADGSIVPVRKQKLLRFFIKIVAEALMTLPPMGKIFEETFMTLPSMGNILIRMSFFNKYSKNLDEANNIVIFPEITLQLKPPNGKLRLQMLELRVSQKATNQLISPKQHIFVPATVEKDIGTVTGSVEAFPSFGRKTELHSTLVSTSMSEIREQQNHVQFTNHLDQRFSSPKTRQLQYPKS